MPSHFFIDKTLLRYLVCSLGCLVVAVSGLAATPAVAQVTRYSSPWGGGTIAAGETVEIADGGSIGGNVITNGTLVFDRTAALTVTNTISGTGSLATANSGTITLLGLTSGTAAFDLGITVPRGELSIGTTGTGFLVIGNSGTGSLTVNGGVMRSRQAFVGLNAGSRGEVTVSSGTWSTNTRTMHVGFGGDGSLTITGGSVANSAVGVGSAGGVGVVMMTGGTWTNGGQVNVGGFAGGVSGNNSGVGSLTLSGGRVTSVSTSIGATAGSVGTVTVTGGTWSTTTNFFVGREGSGTLTISGSGGSGGTVIVGGTFTTDPLATAASINLLPGGTLQIGTGTTASGVLGVDLVNHGAVVFTRTGTSTVSRVISGSGSVATSGGGTFTFSGSSSYTGPTTIGAGRVFVHGGLGQSAVTVAAGGLLGGSGGITGPVTVQAGGTLAPGASIESFATGSVSLLGGAIFDVEIDSAAPLPTAADLLRITGDLSLSGAVSLNLVDLATIPTGFVEGTSLSLINYAGNWNGGLFTYGGQALADGGSFALGGQTWIIDYDATAGGMNFTADHLPSSSFVNIVAVPEPATIVLLMAALGYAGVLRPRRSAARRARATAAASTGNGIA